MKYLQHNFHEHRVNHNVINILSSNCYDWDGWENKYHGTDENILNIIHLIIEKLNEAIKLRVL